MPMVSVIIPTYNRAEFLGDAIRSVLDQDYADYEIIVIDDGSEDGTPEVACAFGKAVRYFRQNNAGVASARNRGLRLAKGRYVAFLDSDDRFLPGKLAAQVACFAERPETGLVYTACRVVRHAGGRGLNRYEAHLFGWVYEDVIFGCNLPTPTVMVRADALAAVGGFDERFRWAEDLDLWRRLARRYPFVALKDVFVEVRRHAGNSRPDPAPIVRDLLAFAEKARLEDSDVDGGRFRLGATTLYMYCAQLMAEYARETPSAARRYQQTARLLAIRAMRQAPFNIWLDACSVYANACRPKVFSWGSPVLWAYLFRRHLRRAMVFGLRAVARFAQLRTSGLRPRRLAFSVRVARAATEVLGGARSTGCRRLALVGVAETAEVVRLCARERRMSIVGIFDDKRVGDRFFAVRVRPTAELRQCWADHVAITGVTFDSRAGAKLNDGLMDAIEMLARSTVWKSRIIWPLGAEPVAMPEEAREAVRRATGFRPAGEEGAAI